MHRLCLLTLMAASTVAVAAAAHQQPASEPSTSPPKPAFKVPFVPDLPGAPEARAWLASYHEQRRGRAAEPPAWPPALGLPSCAELQSEAASARGQGHGEQAAGRQRDKRPERHMILATIGDGWGPDASRNRCAAALKGRAAPAHGHPNLSRHVATCGHVAACVWV